MRPRNEPSEKPRRNSSASEASSLLEQQENQDRARAQAFGDAVQKGFDELDRGDGIAFPNPDELDAYLDARRATKSKPTRS